MTENRSITTTTSNKFFPSVLNLIGSIKKNYPNHPPIYVWDLGLFPTFRAELAGIEGVTVVPIPSFVSFWRKCYTWKTHIFAHPFTDTTLYLDAGIIVYKPLDDYFVEIEQNGYIVFGQNVLCDITTPPDYLTTLDLPSELLNKEVVTAGIFGFSQKNKKVMDVCNRTYAAAKSGLCLGFSPHDAWRNKGVNKTIFWRDCKIFRHDTTLLPLFFHSTIENPIIHKAEETLTLPEKNFTPYILNIRLHDYTYAYISHTCSTSSLARTINHMYIHLFKALRIFNKIIKHKIKTL